MEGTNFTFVISKFAISPCSQITNYSRRKLLYVAKLSIFRATTLCSFDTAYFVLTGVDTTQGVYGLASSSSPPGSNLKLAWLKPQVTPLAAGCNELQPFNADVLYQLRNITAVEIA